jgi:Leucine-rich repeat (LRR) protein
MQTASSSDGPLQLEPPKRRRTTNLPRIPSVLAQEIGSFLGRYELRIYLTQVCSSGLSFLAAPATSPRTAVLRLNVLIRSCYDAICAPPTADWSLYDEPTSTVDPKVGELVVERIASLLSRRSHIQRFVLKVDHQAKRYLRVCSSIEAQVYNQLNQVGCEEAMVQGRKVAIEWQVCAKTVKSLAPFRALHRLDFVRAQVKKFPGLASCRTLHTVDISHSKIVNLAPLASCQALHTLNISRSNVVDVSVLASCQALREVNLSHTNISDVSVLASCPELRKVDLNCTKISDVSALASCQALREVHLIATNVTDVSVLASCLELRHVNLCRTDISDVTALAMCPELRVLMLRNTSVTDVSAFGSCRYLERLNVAYTPVTDVSVLATSQTLRLLEIYSTSVTDVSALVDCVSLRWLWCSRSPRPIGYAEVGRTIDARKKVDPNGWW